MQNYKIKVANEAESKEAQELLFELGYGWSKQDTQNHRYLTPCLYTIDGSLFVLCRESLYSFKEINLPKLRDLVVLHRNDVSDATHKNKYNAEQWYVASDNKLYYFHVSSSKWQLHEGGKVDLILKDYAEAQMTWQDALRAVADGNEVEMLDIHNQWENLKDFYVGDIREPNNKFRLAPQRKTLNGNFTKEELLKIAGEMV